MIVVHVTHEAVEKIGGIGAVIAGLTTADAYAETVSRTILLGPLLTTDRPINLRLGEGGKVLYSSLDAVGGPPWRAKFHPIERTYDVGIVYGTREVRETCSHKTAEVEVILVDVFHANRNRLNLFKADLFGKFAVPSMAYEEVWEYEQYVRLGEPGFEALKAIGCDGENEPVTLLAHEYMGMPTALKAVLSGSQNMRTVFYAHEVASVRAVIEEIPGHDTTFYNAMTAGIEAGKDLETVFPDRLGGNFKHPLVRAARYCDQVFAVGDYIVKELEFLDPHFRRMDVDLVYNGVPAEPLSLQDRGASRSRMLEYSAALFGQAATWIFTHVCRPVISKGIWRDLRVLHEMEPLLAERNESGVFFLLGTLAGQRRSRDVHQMERVYGWPVAHEKGYPDLCGGEEVLGEMFDCFNHEHQAVRAVLVNQWDWNSQACGERMPPDMTFPDIRRGTDVEFGLSVYEPFGISQLEPLSFGALCVVSNVCGCMGFLRRVADEEQWSDNIVEGNFLGAPEGAGAEQFRDLPADERDRIESDEARRLAREIVRRLAGDDQAVSRRIRSGHDLARRMSWEYVVEDYFLPALRPEARGA